MFSETVRSGWAGVVVLSVTLGCGGATTVDSDPATGGSGGSGTGGTSSSGGTGGVAGCADATVTFRVVGGGTPGTTFCIGADCDSTWLSVRTEDGTPLFFSNGCSVLCDGCTSTGCSGACFQPYLLDADGEERVWDGSYFSPTGMCGGGECLEERCASAGMPLVATMCAYRQADGATSCPSGIAPTCVELPFQFGVDNEVVSVLDTTK